MCLGGEQGEGYHIVSEACVHATKALVEVETVPPRVVRVSVASSIMRSVGDSVGTVQCVGYRLHVSATLYCFVPGIQNLRHQ